MQQIKRSSFVPYDSRKENVTSAARETRLSRHNGGPIKGPLYQGGPQLGTMMSEDAVCSDIQGLDKIIETLPFLVLYLKIRFHTKY